MAGNPATGVLACAARWPERQRHAGAVRVWAGQHAEYIQAQMLAFKKEERANDLNSMMRQIASFK